jgi:hypothetical protein
MNWHRPRNEWEWLILLSPTALALFTSLAFNKLGWPGNPNLEGGSFLNYSSGLVVLAASSFGFAVWLTRGFGSTLPRCEKTIALTLMIFFVNAFVAMGGCAFAGATGIVR